ncbi:unnamed protein product, partial [Rotaria sp. Silwood2]
FIHCQSLESNKNCFILSESDKLKLKSKSSLEFVDHIRSLISRDQSIPYITLSTSSTNISDSDFEKNLSQFVRILTKQYIEKQENVCKELENKENYLYDFQQTQFNENKQLNEKSSQ